MNNNYYENESLGVSFRLPEKMTIRQQLEAQNRVWDIGDDSPAAIRFWFGMLPFVKDWESKDFPEPDKIDLDNDTDPKATAIINWASNQMAGYFMEMGYIPKVG